MLKKYLLLMLSLLLAASLVACGGGLSANSLVKGDDIPVSSEGSSNANLKAQIQNCTPLVDYAENALIDHMDTITFGLDSDSEPIEWIVLEKEGNKALLLSRFLLKERRYNDEDKEITWENCTLREWLNSDFMNQTFSKKERNSILTIDVINSDNEEYGTKGGNNTKDKIFLLSIDEFKKYFPKGSKATYKNGSGDFWWLRSPGYNQDYAATVSNSGHLYDYGDYVDYGNGVRPALWVKY